MVVAGSHRLLNDGRFRTQPQVREALRNLPFFTRFYAEPPTDPDDRARLMSETQLVHDVELKVIELTRKGSAKHGRRAALLRANRSVQ